MIAAVVPAAGEGRRMGRPKLTLTVGGVAVIARVVAALRDGGVSVVVVVAPPADAEGAGELHIEAERAGAVVVVPEFRPADMRASAELGLQRLERDGVRPSAVLLSPGDSPGLTPGLVARVVGAWRAEPGRVVVPTSGGRRGHPVAFPWSVALEIRDLPAGVGVNALIAGRPGLVLEVETGDPSVLDDLDTPADYARYAHRHGEADGGCPSGDPPR